MTDPSGRHAGEPAATAPAGAPAHGSTAVGARAVGQPAADQSLAERPTTEVPYGRYEVREQNLPGNRTPAGDPDGDGWSTPQPHAAGPVSSPGWAAGPVSSPGWAAGPVSSPGWAAGPVSSPGWAAGPDQPRYDDRYDRYDDRRDDDGRTRTMPDYTATPVAVRRSDNLAGLLLLLAGMAAGVSLLLVWLSGGQTGLELVTAGIEDVEQDVGALGETGSWQALAVVLGGAALFLLGLLLFVPARTHRFLGALALLVSLVVAAGVLVPLADANWDVERYEVGAWFTVAVGGLGLLGAFKALMTGPRTSRS